MGARLRLRGRLLCIVFCFCSQAIPILRLWGRNYACGGGFYAQDFAFSAKQFPFYAYGSAIRPAGAACKAGILFFKIIQRLVLHLKAGTLRLLRNLLCYLTTQRPIKLEQNKTEFYKLLKRLKPLESLLKGT